ncbi:hypothetical protein RF11_08176 [Thelohanellus kitauei]|uniref:Uncharacterized protein n=1 Tax=Thelohanellus kitauei TaxID=669202 RepID=A0A0C2NIF1_THEKT|nr:hypothetical protein RF11_08176 [Thelohanellus kitauei]
MSVNAYLQYVLIDQEKNNIGPAIGQASNDFYDQADDLRVKVGYEHICEFSAEYMLKQHFEISYALNQEIEKMCSFQCIVHSFDQAMINIYPKYVRFKNNDIVHWVMENREKLKDDVLCNCVSKSILIQTKNPQQI